jgi:hypothetical protein
VLKLIHECLFFWINIRYFFNFHLGGVEESIVNALYWLRITDQLFKILRFIRVVRSQSTLQSLLQGEI